MQLFEQLTQVALVRVHGRTENKNVVKVDITKFANENTKDIGNVTLKDGSRSVFQTERHD